MTTEPTDDQITEVVMEFLYLPSTPESVGVRNMAAEIVQLRAERDEARRERDVLHRSAVARPMPVAEIVRLRAERDEALRRIDKALKVLTGKA